MPMMSGLASGLRAMRWKIAPDRPNAAPTSTAVRPRGRRSVRTMKSVSGWPRPDERRHHVAERDREVADGQRPGEHDAAPRRRAPTVTTSGRTATRADRPRRAERSTRAPSGARRGDGDHSSASFRRRTRAMKNGAPTKAVTMPTCTSPGRAIEPPDDVGAEQQDRRQHQRVGQDPAVVGTADRPGHVGHGEADEADRAGGGRGRPAQQHDRQRRQAPGQVRPAGRATGRRRRRATRVLSARADASASTAPTMRNGATWRDDRRRRGRPASRPPRTGTGRASARRAAGSPW